jgi:hypothetical protein|nr:MAG TPA_asm: hypothetical protein [Caudoviricetes sp.]
MEEKINIAEILKDKPQGTKLYSSACGKCKLEEVDDKSFKISFYNSKFGFMNGGEGYLDKNGKLYDDGECVVFPSKEMRDWSKFAWKRGDVLVNKYNNSHIIFDKFNDDTYTTFTGKLFFQVVKAGYNYTHTCSDVMTQNFDIEKGDAVQTYINAIEERLGGKLNRETLEVEKTQPEFKDGDIITFKDRIIIIYNTSIEKSPTRTGIYYHACLKEGKLTVNEYLISCGFGEGWYSSTEEEKHQLFDALAKEGKAWDAEKKQIVDLKSKIELKPFDKVLVRDSESDKWRANLFGYIDKDEYYHCVYANWVYCISYAGNEHLLGTTKDVED